MNFPPIPDLPAKGGIPGTSSRTGGDPPPSGSLPDDDGSRPFAETDGMISSRTAEEARIDLPSDRQKVRCPDCGSPLVCRSSYLAAVGKCPTCGVELRLAVEVRACMDQRGWRGLRKSA